MDVFIRTDLSLEIGTGHAMRCLSLSKELKKHNINTKFIFRDYKDGTRNFIEQIFPNAYFVKGPLKKKNYQKDGEYRWNKSSQIDDAKQTKKILNKFNVDWLIIDHYSIDKSWESIVQASVKNILVIDDLHDRDHVCNALTDPSMNIMNHKIYKRRVNKHADLLLGNKYALIDPKYLKYRSKVRKKNFSNPRILIFFGGIDIEDYTYQATEFIAESKIKHRGVDVIVGSNYNNKSKLKALCKKHKFNLVIQTNKMHEFINNCDIAIGSGGTSTWERCALGLPAFVYPIANNQRELVRIASKDALVFSPNHDKDFNKFLNMHLLSFIQNKSMLEYLSKKSFSSIDAKGCMRISNYMINKSLVARYATIKDSRRILNWRNTKIIRNFSRNKKIISLKDHNKWIEEVLHSKKESLIIVEKNKDPVGVVRFTNLDSKTSEVSIYLVPKYIGRGFGIGVLDSAEELFRSKFKDIKHIKANVLATNDTSQNLFLKSKYEYENLWLSKKIN